jgi:transporter family-2 protein
MAVGSTLPASTSALFLLLLFLIAFGSGSMIVLQAVVNSAMGVYLGTATLATFVSFSIGLVCLTLMVLLEAWALGLPLLWWRERPHPTLLLPGPCGVVFVTSSVFLTLSLGFSLYYISLVTGQLAAATLADAYGFGVKDNQPIPPTLARLALLALALVGVLLSVLEALLGGTATFPPIYLVWCLLSFITGAISLAQSVLNRRASALLASRLQATWWSFCIGTLVALLVFGLQAASLGSTEALTRAVTARAGSLQGYHFIGGILGVAFVWAAILVPERIGSQAFSVASVSGQLVCSAAMDSVGALGIQARALSPLRVAGVVLVLAAATAMQLPPAQCCPASPPAAAVAASAGASEGEGSARVEAVKVAA